ncbi:MAG: 1,5-anhydro-D-fructose reductase [Chloroflexi bacterium ADurb.Bin344]|nr:MAG: 1,5-anhydro-D-fructose reductase [Chloroflexi bacterium ADurb.Bin344]
MIKIGIMSFAHLHAEAYIQNIRSIPGVEWIGFVDPDNDRVKQFSEQYRTWGTSDFDEFFAKKPDGVVICSENNNHLSMVETAIAAGVKNICCEKPLATTLEDAEKIVSLTESKKINLMTAFPMRFSAPIVAVKDQLDRGVYGKIYCFRSENEGQMPSLHRKWFVDKKLAGGGALQDHLVHLTDLFRWITKSEVDSVYAQSSQCFHRGEVDVETAGMAMLHFKNDCFATIDCSWSRPDYYPTWGGLNFEVVTDRGAVQVDAFRQNLSVYRHDIQNQVWHYWGSDSNQGMIEEFAASIREERPACITATDGLRAVEVVQAAYESAASGKTVKL